MYAFLQMTLLFVAVKKLINVIQKIAELREIL